MHAYFFKLLTDVIGYVPAPARVPRPAPPPHLRLRTLRLQDQAGHPQNINKVKGVSQYSKIRTH